MRLSELVAAAAAVSAAGGLAWAEPVVTFADGPGTTQGGIYIATTDEFGVFDTFCLETGEGLTTGFTYEYTISTDIMFKGQGIVDPLNEETAFLYTEFREGDIPDLLGDPGIDIVDLANAIQLAIWFIEESRATDDANALELVQIAQDAVNSGQWDGLGDVRVMNVWDPGHVGEEDHAKQDVLVLIPAPSALALAALGILGVSRRRS
ncbi:MAG TPA: hypothetical protein VFF69_15000 [Phycisphaerales bacterium]|nr:hypothetical protein [Phycisphaerales bacterium]